MPRRAGDRAPMFGAGPDAGPLSSGDARRAGVDGASKNGAGDSDAAVRCVGIGGDLICSAITRSLT